MSKVHSSFIFSPLNSSIIERVILMEDKSNIAWLMI